MKKLYEKAGKVYTIHEAYTIIKRIVVYEVQDAKDNV